jgi:putative ABC transport system permease protein
MSLLQEFGQAVRALRRERSFAIVAIAVFAIGIGATTAIFTLIQRVVLDPLAYPAADRLVRIKSPVPKLGDGTEWGVAPAELEYFRANARTIERFGAYRAGGSNVQTPDGPQRVTSAVAEASLLGMLGAQAVIGRLYGESDDRDGAAPVVVLSYGFWQRAWGGDRDVIGRTLTLNEMPFEIIGVANAGLRLPDEPGGGMVPSADLWIPLGFDIDRTSFSHTLPVIGRLAAGATIEQAQAELMRLTARLPEALPQGYGAGWFERYGFSTKVYDLKSYVVGSTARNLWILLGGVSLVLLIACLNVANLFLVRVEGRRREMAVRAALGAGRVAIVRQFLAESLVVALAGGMLAVALGWWGVDWLVTIAPDSVPRLAELRLGGASIALTFAIAILVACILAIFPALQHRRGIGTGELVDGGRTSTSGRERQRLRGALVATQVALAFVLLVAAGLLINSFQRLRSVDPGVDPDGVLTMDLYVPPSRYGEAADTWRFYSRLLDRIERLPGVTQAGLSEEIPFTGAYGCTVQGFEDAAVYDRLEGDGGSTCAGQEYTSPGFFEAMGIALVEGRAFTAADNDQPGTGAVIVSRAFAEKFWPGENAIGKGVAPNGWRDQPFYHVVGVTGDVYSSSLEEPPALVAYYPIVYIPSETKRPWSPFYNHLVVKTSLADPASIFAQVRATINELDPTIPVANAELLETTVARSMSRLSFTMTMLALAATVALVLAAVGLYGVIAYIVSRRTREIGVRVALGAQPSGVAMLVLGGSIRMVALGLGIGCIGALALTGLMRSLLYGVQATDPLTYAAAIVVLSAVSLFASWVPARRAAKVDPMVAMRTE